jgi:hypothetical protein
VVALGTRCDCGGVRADVSRSQNTDEEKAADDEVSRSHMPS